MTKMLKQIFILSIAFIFISSAVFSQSRESGTLEGTIKDDEGQPLPGVSINLSSPKLMGTRSTVTEKNGKYRFIVLPAGTYTIEASLQGFTPAKIEKIRVHIGATYVVDIVLKIATVGEEVLVIAEAPVVDLQDSSTGKVIFTTDFLENIPSARETSTLLQLAPGVAEGPEVLSAFGGSANSSNALHLDGADMTEGYWGGSGWVSLKYDNIEEFQVIGRGAPAEYGGYTGALVSGITKSGGNRFEGMVEFLYAARPWLSDNLDETDPQFSLLEDAPEERFLDVVFNIGGPIVKDKLWFFGSFSYQQINQLVPEWDEDTLSKNPLGFLKLSFQPNANSRIQAFAQLGTDDWLKFAMEALRPPEVTLDIKNRKFIWNVSSSHILSPNTFLEVKVAGFRAPQWADPASGEDTPSHLDLSTGLTFGGTSGNYPFAVKRKMNRFQANASLTHHQEDFIVGSHDFKIGAAYFRQWSQTKVTTNGDWWYQDNIGIPGLSLAIHIGWDLKPLSNQIALFAQDRWSITDNFTLNPGIRFEIYRGHLKTRGETVYKATGFMPRMGFTWDIFGDHKTALKAHYGKYNNQLLLGFIEDMDTGWDDQVVNLVEAGTGTVLMELQRIPLAEQARTLYTLDPDIKQPTMDEITVGIDRELIPDLSFGVSFIYRKWTNFVEQVNTGGIWAPTQVTVPDGSTVTVWNQLNPGGDNYFITNPEPGKDYGQALEDIVAVKPEREYKGVEFLLNKRFSKNWMLLASYIYSQTTGTLGNDYRSSYGKNYMFHSPNGQLNAEGHLVIDPTHLFKIQGTVIFPLDIFLSVNFSYSSGLTWQKELNVILNQGFVDVFIEPRGSQRLSSLTNLDLRLEKTFAISETARVGLIADVFNAFNSGIETGIISTVNSANFEKFRGIILPRRFRVGVRLFF